MRLGEQERDSAMICCLTDDDADDQSAAIREICLSISFAGHSVVEEEKEESMHRSRLPVYVFLFSMGDCDLHFISK